MPILRMRNACWITKATSTNSEYVILITVPLQQWVHERASLLCCTCLATWNSQEFKIIVFSPIVLWGKYVIYVSVLNKEQSIGLCGLDIFTGPHVSVTARLQIVHPVTQYTDYWGVLYFRYVIRFHGTRANAISSKPIKEVWLSVRRFSAYSRRLNSTVYRILNFTQTGK
jgi:hypothetical protein